VAAASAEVAEGVTDAGGQATAVAHEALEDHGRMARMTAVEEDCFVSLALFHAKMRASFYMPLLEVRANFGA
jgi:hypothetical protein